MTDIIREAIPAAWRKPTYAVYAALGVALGAVQVGFAAAEVGQPVWLTVALAVYTFVGGAVGITAATYTPGRGTPASEVKSMGPEDFESEDDEPIKASRVKSWGRDGSVEDVPDGSVDFARHEHE